MKTKNILSYSRSRATIDMKTKDLKLEKAIFFRIPYTVRKLHNKYIYRFNNDSDWERVITFLGIL